MSASRRDPCPLPDGQKHPFQQQLLINRHLGLRRDGFALFFTGGFDFLQAPYKTQTVFGISPFHGSIESGMKGFFASDCHDGSLERARNIHKRPGDRLYLDSGTLTPVLKTLERRGYAARQCSKLDEQVVVVLLTKEGAALKEKALSVPEQMSGQLMQRGFR